MKKDIHPTTHPVIFVDTSCGAEFVTTSTMTSEQTREIGGIPHYVINVEVSSASHPFYTGEQRLMDTGGRVEKFKEKMAKIQEVANVRKGKKAKRAVRVKAAVDAARVSKKKKKEESAATEPIVSEAAPAPKEEAAAQ